MVDKVKKSSSVAQPTAQPQSLSNHSAPQVTRTSMVPTVPKTDSLAPEGDLCMKHKRKIEIICIDCKERICSNCALFDDHRLHNIKMEAEVLEEINNRSECLMEMYQMIE